MTESADPWMVDAVWRATDLTRAYLSQNRLQVEACLSGLDTGRLERVRAWLVLEHDELFDRLGEPTMAVRHLDVVAALSPMENELATSVAVRRVAAQETRLTAALGDLALPDQVHAVAVCTTVMALQALGRVRALEEVDAKAVEYERLGHPRPYPAI
ncbi:MULTISPECIES: hypothetical protein [unclassified Streptomyces]|uniref:hypothetical protein n=1 Tax=unclassified Streptomyces TaxID=2593676 RepID=UPI000DC7639D|nr:MULTISPECIES: hypothetical protein [unclassified Streptomyces]AWZ08362.1 hypothetical protein DRB89_31500 [Streptomyces sp. ICC4]AWZ15916.1 hypothetical protein DRB96_30775 [Streptomyces sp. ICC1]